MNLTSHFTLKEFTDSDTALRLGIDNDLPIELLAEARRTAELLEGIRYHLSSLAGKPVPIQITSGYRCEKLERVICDAAYRDWCIRRGVGANDTSWAEYFKTKTHPLANSADFKAPAFGNPLQVARALADAVDVLKIGQLIYEFTWIHVSTRVPSKIFNRILTVQGKGYVSGIQG